MALIKCKECGNDVSTTAIACPKCGAKVIARRNYGCGTITLVGFICIIALGALGTCVGRSGAPSTNVTAATTSPAQVNSPAPPVPASPQPGEQWRYNVEQDPMGNNHSYFASVTSENTLNFDSPYTGPQHGTLLLRDHPRHGKDVVVSIERGQILCRSYEDCEILVRFDEQKATTYAAVGPADGSTEHVFIRNYSRFVAGMQKAKTVRIALPVYRHGNPVLEFNVEGFDAAKYRPNTR